MALQSLTNLGVKRVEKILQKWGSKNFLKKYLPSSLKCDILDFAVTLIAVKREVVQLSCSFPWSEGQSIWQQSHCTTQFVLRILREGQPSIYF